jgi:hypothetical protein
MVKLWQLAFPIPSTNFWSAQAASNEGAARDTIGQIAETGRLD